MPVTQGTLDALDDLVKQTSRITDDRARSLVRAYADAWDTVERALQEAVQDVLKDAEDGYVTRAKMARSKRLQRALAHITDELTRLGRAAGLTITSDLHAAVTAAGQTQTKVLKSMLPAEAEVAGWDRIDKGSIDAIIKRSTTQIEKRTRALPKEQARILKQELIRGVSVGSNPNETARRIVKQAQGRFEGGSARAVRIARTETLDAMREGQRLVDKKNADLTTGWQWVASLGPRTCQACIGMHGNTFPPETPGPEGHPNCRCTRAPVTKSWAALGFKGIEEPPDLLPSADRWFKALPQAEQKRMLGPKYEDWKAGKFPRSQWATKQKNPGWRDSYMPTR